ncbi:YadA C-terminal domain-containing protein [Aliivibrio salmonicida]|uniref:YadA C-terminal domain-containing protein n=1 Tax=Aliivibrio salmonicida TaxID=40269 RepID=UPI00406BF3A9
MKKSILALSVLSVLSFGASAGGVDKDVHAKVSTFNTAMEKAGNEAAITLGDNGAYTITFTEHGETQTIELTSQDTAAMKQRMAKQAYDNVDSGKSEENFKKLASNVIPKHIKNGSDIINKEIVLENAIKYRMKNENKYKFSGSEKIAAVNRLTGAELELHYDLDGNSFLVNKTTGEQFKPEQVKELALNARKQIQEEAAKRVADKPSIPDAPVEDMPEVGLDKEQVKESVEQFVKSGQSLTEYGYASQAQMQQQTASIDANAANIDELFNVTADLREDLELQGARNMAAISARAFTTVEGEVSVGVGLGGSGSENAMAIGGAYQINANWSANTTIAFDTGSNVDYGVGVHYAF